MRDILRTPEKSDEFHDLLTVHHGRRMLKVTTGEDAKMLAFELGLICGKRGWELPVQKEYAPKNPLTLRM